MRRRDFITPLGGAAVWSVAVRAQLVAAFLIFGSAHASDNEHWAAAKPTNLHAWFESLTQPNNPTASCCGEADAFEADAFEVEGDHYVAIVTNGRGDFPTGARISVPNYKIKWDSGNPTGHGIIFIGAMPT
jgi:hypothetical protein